MATDIDIVRVLIPDNDKVFGDAENEYMFSDDEINAFLIAGSGSTLRAAGLANYAIATSEAIISKVIRTQDLQTNGAAVANALILKANALMARADRIDSTTDAGYFNIIDFGEGWSTERAELTEFDEYGNKING